MIKKLCEGTDINCGFPPFMSVINTDFSFPQSVSDGVYFQVIDGERTLLFSLRGVTATICVSSENADITELTSFLEFQGIKNILSDSFFDGVNLEERAVLTAVPEKYDVCNLIALSPLSRACDYQKIFELLSRNGSFETWFPLFSSKVNNNFAFGVYTEENSVPVSCAVAPFVSGKSGVIAGVFTSEEYRNRGNATKCIKALLNELKKNCVEEVYLWCEEKNIKLYENIGFSRCEKIYVKKEE